MQPSSILFWSALGSAFGGFVGVFIFFSVRVFIAWMRSKPSIIHVYYCGNPLNQEQPGESDGELKHHHGKRISDKTEYEGLNPFGLYSPPLAASSSFRRKPESRRPDWIPHQVRNDRI